MEAVNTNINSFIRQLFLRLKHWWRLGAITFCFILFGVGGLTLSTACFPLLRLFVRNEGKRHQLTQDSIRHSFRFFMWVAEFLGVLTLRIEGAELFKQDKGCLVVANHPSLLDYVILASVMPRCDCIVKGSLLSNFFMSGVIKSAGYMANSNSDLLLEECKEKISRGGTLLIFPEGTRSVPKQPIKLQRGAANIALRCDADIRIVHIWCEPVMLTKQDKWYKVPPDKTIYTVFIRNKLEIQPFKIESEKSLAIAARRLTSELKNQLTHPFYFTSEITGMNELELQKEIKLLIIESLNLEDISVDDIRSSAPLFGEGLGLDSIDALELGLALKNSYGVVLSAESDETRKHFYSVETLATFVVSQRK